MKKPVSKPSSEIILYQTEDGRTRQLVRIAYKFKSKATIRKFRIVRFEGARQVIGNGPPDFGHGSPFIRTQNWRDVQTEPASVGF
jgi:hypothetical protein